MGKNKKSDNDSVEFDFSGISKKISGVSKKTKDIYSEKPLLAKSIIIAVLLIISMTFSYSVRNDSADLEITTSWAEQTFNNALRNQAAGVVREQYPNLQGADFNSRVDEVAAQIRQQIPNYDEQIQSQAAFFRERLQIEMPDGSQQTYLLAIDPWQYYRLTQNYLENGHPGDELRDGQPWNTKMVAPIGTAQENNFHIKFSAFWHKIYSIFNPGAQLLQSFFWVPVVISMLAVIPAFFIAYRKTNFLGGFIASLVVATHPYFISRTAAGFSDTDAYNIFFPLLITWLVIESFEAKSLRNKAILGTAAGLAVGIFSYAWAGWWYIFDFMVVGILGYFYFVVLEKKMETELWDWKYKLAYFLAPFIGLGLYVTKILPSIIGGLIFFAWAIYFLYDAVKFYISKEKKFKTFNEKINQTLISFGSFVLTSMIFVTLFKSFNFFLGAIKQPLGFTVIQQAAQANLWPNVYTTVAELNQASLAQIITNIGFSLANAKLFFFIAILGIAFSFTKDRLKKNDWAILGLTVLFGIFILENLNASIINFIVLLSLPLIAGVYFSINRGVDVKPALFVTIWFVGTMYASTQGVRFILLMVPVFAVALGIAFGKFYQILQSYLKSEFKLKLVSRIALNVLLVVLLLTFMIKPVARGYEVAENEVPSFDDAWWESLKAIENDSQTDAIVNSWWDFGHWFKAVSNRAVTFDGASQNTPQAHWIGRALSASDETETLGILRMLDCGANTAFDKLFLNGYSNIESIKILKEMIIEDKDSAREIAREHGVEDIEGLLELTHCTPPENYFITSGDMIGKSGVWSHFGNWDFNKAYIYRNRNNAEALVGASETLELSQDQVDDLLFTAKGLTEAQANQWIGPFDGYLAGGSRISCSGTEEVTCTGQLQLSSDSRGINVLEQVRIYDDYEKTQVQIGVYAHTTGQRLGGNSFTPSAIVIADDEEMNKFSLQNASSGFDVIYDSVNNNVMISGPAVSDSTFTKLFFFDGRYSQDNFEKLIDRTTVTGNRIIVWKVNWNEN